MSTMSKQVEENKIINVKESVELAHQLRKREKYKEAWNLYKLAAKQHDPDGELWWSYMYLKILRPKFPLATINDRNAFHFSKKNLSSCYPLAYYTLGLCYSYGMKGYTEKNLKISIELWHKGAYFGNCECQVELGFIYLTGKYDVQQSSTLGIGFYRMAVDQGDSMGQFYLGNCYEIGEGVKKDFKEACGLYRLAAKQQMLQALVRLLYIFESPTPGSGLYKDRNEALYLSRNATLNGITCERKRILDTGEILYLIGETCYKFPFFFINEM